MRHCFWLLALWLGLAGTASAQRLTITADHPNGVYRVGETVRWTIRFGGPAAETPLSYGYVLKRGGLAERETGRVTAVNGVAQVEATCTAPEALLLEATAGTSYRGQGGVVIAPEKIALAAPRPRDFDRFWAEKIAALAKIPANPRWEPGDAGRPGVTYGKLTLDHWGGSKIQGQLARPSTGAKFPALLIVQWAGVYGLDKRWATDRAADGWLVLNIEAHDLPIDQPAAFYQDQFAGPLKNYWAIGNDSRETSYFLRMYLSCYRAAQYLTERPEWDGKTLVVMGGSQGGMQALVTAAIHPRITAALASVPAGCDFLGPQMGRQAGWPQWYWQTQGKDPAKVREASRYFDVANFASRVTCPVLIGCGLIDQTCPPEGILAAAAQLRGPSEVVLLPQGGHQDENNSHGPYNQRCWQDWLPALRQGKPAPIRRGVH